MENEVVIIPGVCVTYAGHDAVDLFRARVLASSLRLYAKTEIIPSRGVTITKMLKLATHYTGVSYGRGTAEVAAMDVKAWADAFALSLPHVVK